MSKQLLNFILATRICPGHRNIHEMTGIPIGKNANPSR
jgi:hypothetical protein